MTPNAAASAYAALAKVGQAASESAKPFADTGAFAGMLEQQVAGLMDNARAAEQAGLAAAAGKADVVDVVTAVAETELALETLVSVRDRVIQAYEEIMRMPI